MSDTPSVFEVGNKHAPSSGKPPRIDGSQPGRYYGYFENEYGEQAVFVYEYKTKVGMLWMGDAGWDSPTQVVDGDTPNMILNGTEKLWLQACWQAATTTSR